MNTDIINSLNNDKQDIYNFLYTYNKTISPSYTFTQLINAMNNTRMTYPIHYLCYTGAVFGEMNLEDHNVKELTSLAGTFAKSSPLHTLHVNTWDTANVTNMLATFQNCGNLKNITDIGNWNTYKVTNMVALFDGCYNLQSVNINSWKTNNVTNMSEMFARCANLNATPNMLKWNLNKVIGMNNMFNYCPISEINLTGKNLSSVQYTKNMFFNCTNLKTVNFYNTNWNNLQYATRMFYSANNLTSLNINSCNMNSLINTVGMFAYCGNLTSIYVYNLRMNNVTDMAEMFKYCRNLSTIGGFSSWNLSSVTNMTNAFYYCNSLSSTSIQYLVNVLPTATQLSNQYLKNMGLNIEKLTYDQLHILNNKGYIDAYLPIYNINMA